MKKQCPVEVIDHLIISVDIYYSFDDQKLMEELRESKKWVPRHKEEERIRKDALKIGEIPLWLIFISVQLVDFYVFFM